MLALVEGRIACQLEAFNAVSNLLATGAILAGWRRVVCDVWVHSGEVLVATSRPHLCFTVSVLVVVRLMPGCGEIVPASCGK